jgi:L-threonylcarbamoyladenylate synthase
VPRPADEAGVAAAVDALSRGSLVLHPTETVVSLSGDPGNEIAVRAARALKGYAEPRPFICLVPGIDAARGLVREWPPAAERLAAAFWPGPLTLVLPAAAAAPRAVGGDGTIAIRPAADPVSAAILAAWRRPLFSTSANRRGEAPPADIPAALELLSPAGDDRIEVALEPLAPAAPVGRPSTIVDAGARPPRLLREGAIPAARIRAVVADLRGPG